MIDLTRAGVDFFKQDFWGLKLIKKEKEEKVEDIKHVFESGSPIIFADHSGLKAENIFNMRNKLADSDACIKIVKNTLALLAAVQVHPDMDLTQIFTGPTSMIVSGENVVAQQSLLRNSQKSLKLSK